MIGNKLKQLRIESGCSLQQFADKMNVARNTIRNYENGTTIPDVIFIKNISKEFDIPLESLIYEDNEYEEYMNNLEHKIPIDLEDPFSLFKTKLHLLLDNAESEEETLLLNSFLELHDVLHNLHCQCTFYTDPNRAKYFLSELYEKGIDFEDAYLMLDPLRFYGHGKSKSLKSFQESLEKILNYYDTKIEKNLNHQFDKIYGRHTLD